MQGRLAALETAENPFAEISEQLTRLYAQKDATVETVFARLAPLEAKLAALDPAAALDRFAERLEAVQGRLAALETRGEPVRRDLRAADPALRPEGRDGGDGVRPAGAAGGEARRRSTRPRRSTASPSGWRRCRAGSRRSRRAENPFAEISEQLTRLYAQKDATVETVFARLAPLEAKLAALDPAAALDRFAERLEAVQGRLAALETAENPFAEISEQLTRLYAQKDATVETVFARLAPLEAKLAALDPAAALDRFAERLEAVQGRVAAIETRGEPVRRDLRAADPALRPEGRDGRDGVRPAGAAGGEARRARPGRGARPLRRAAGGGAGPGGGDRDARRTRSPRSPSS